MRKFVVVCIAALALQGCAIPVPLQIASWVIDGVSLLATHKSLTDHGISALAQQDCSLWRGVSEGEVCQDYQDTQLAANTLEEDNAPAAGGTSSAQDVQLLPVSLSSFGAVQPGVYVVIGSSRNLDTAHQITGKYPELLPITLTSKTSKEEVHRVVVGPLQKGEENKVVSSIADRGVTNTWAIRIDPKDWSVSHATVANKGALKSDGPSLAALPN